jgi:ferrous iron transport protein B
MSTLALVGAPNSGKSSLFNALTGKNQKIANFPGATIDTAVGRFGKNLIVDLPGIYGLKATTIDERISRDYIIGNDQNTYLQKLSLEERSYQSLIVIADATRLKKSLYLCIELLKLETPLTLVLNRSDMAKKRGQIVDLDFLKKELNIQVIETSVFDKVSITKLKEIIEVAKTTSNPLKISKQKLQTVINSKDWAKDNFTYIDKVLEQAIIKKITPDTLTEKIDKYALHPILGPIISIGIFFIVFNLLFYYAAPFQDMIGEMFDLIIGMVEKLSLPEIVTNFINDGVIAGVGGTIVFVPQISFLFFAIGILEQSGYMSRLAYLLDYGMLKLGLSGKAIIPLLSSHACAVPGIMGARNLQSERQRILTILVAPLTTCSARLPVYVLLLSCFLPIKYQGLGLLSLYILGIVTTFLSAFIINKLIAGYKKGSAQHLTLDLPDYQVPNLVNVAKMAIAKSWIFVKKAGTVIIFFTIVLWVLSYFPRTLENKTPPIEKSYAGMVGSSITPIFAPLGFDTKITTALIPSFAAREVMVASMATVLSVEDSESEQGVAKLTDVIRSQYPIGTILALIVWFAFSPQCISTFAVIKRETSGYKWPLITFGYTLALAYLSAFVVKIIF